MSTFDLLEVSTAAPDPHLQDVSASNSSSCTNSSQCDVLNSLSSFLTQYNIWIVFAFGFPGNLVSFFVIVRMSRKKVTSSLMYVALLAVVDNVAIIMKILIIELTNKTLVMGPVRCRMLIFCGLTLVAYANWILIVMSAERYTAVGFPLKVGLIWSLRRAMSIIVLVFLLLCAVHFHIFFTIDGADRSCWPKQDFLSFYHPWWFFISSSVFSFIPALSIIVFGILIIRVMRRSTVKRKTLLSTNKSGVKESRQQERQVTVMLVTLAIVFITLTTPRCVFLITMNHWIPQDDIGSARKRFTDAFTNSLADLNHLINFYLYFIAITKFRTYTLHCCCYFRSLGRVETQSGSTQISELSLKRLSKRIFD